MDTSSAAALLLPKPLLRGWFHAGAGVASVIITIIFCAITAHDPPKLVSLLIFGLTMVELYTVSAVYHIGRWSEQPRKVLRSIDHANIFLLIAGTYTPLCFNLLHGWFRVALLVGIWSLAAIGLGLAVYTTHLPRWLSPLLYVLMGWTALLAMPAFAAATSWALILLLLTGGILYSVGALIYGRRWPNPSPRIFGFHEIFHIFVIAGSIVFVIVMFIWVIPFMRV